MNSFYEQIARVSELHKKEKPEVPDSNVHISEEDERIVLEMHIEEIMELICENYKDNIRVAAERGDTRAILCLYQEKSKYRRVINVHKLLNPHKTLFEKYSLYEIPILMDRLQDMFNPFRVVVNPLDTNDETKYYTIAVEWTSVAPNTETHDQTNNSETINVLD